MFKTLINKLSTPAQNTPNDEPRYEKQFSSIPFGPSSSTYQADFQINQSIQGYSKYQFFSYYNTISCLENAINLLASQFSSLNMYLFDKRNRTIIKNHPVLDFFKKPNFTDNYLQFALKEMIFYNVSGNCYWIMDNGGRIDGTPVFLFCISPLLISPIETSQYGGFYYNPQDAGSGRIGFYGNIINGQLRYFNKDSTKELFYVSRPNGLYNSGMDVKDIMSPGTSRLLSLAPQLECFQSALLHNIALLKQAGMPCGILTNKDEANTLTPDQRDELMANWTAQVGGAQNAGRLLIGDNLMYQPFSFSNKELNYVEARQQLKEEIYNHFHIPLALINSDSLSLANMIVAERLMYNLAIIPEADKIYTALTNNILWRYGNTTRNLEFCFDQFEVPSLRDKKIEELLKIKEMGVYSDNELRKAIDSPLVQDRAADEVYKASNQVPSSYIVPTPSR